MMLNYSDKVLLKKIGMILCVAGVIISVYLSPQKWYVDLFEIMKIICLIGVGYFLRLSEE